MDEIINKLIDIDNNAKNIIKEENDKKNNFEEYVESEFNTKKAILDLEYKEEINKQKEKMYNAIKENKTKVENEVNQEIEKIREDYNKIEQELFFKIINKIKNQEE